MIPGAAVNEMDLYIDRTLCPRCFSLVRERAVDDVTTKVSCLNRQCGYEATEREGGARSVAINGYQPKTLRKKFEWRNYR